MTLVSSAVRNDLDVWACLKDVLDRLLCGDTDYASLRPDIWGCSHPESIRVYRTAKRRDRADCKQLRRSQRRVVRSTTDSPWPSALQSRSGVGMASVGAYRECVITPTFFRTTHGGILVGLSNWARA